MKLKRILWKYQPHKDGRCDIKFYIYIHNKTKVYSSGLSVLPNHWDEVRGLVKKNHPLALAYNTQLQKLHLELEAHFLRGGTFQDFRKKEETPNLIDYCKQVIQKAEKGLLPLAAGTLKSYRATRRRLKEYSAHHRDPDLSLGGIDMDFYHQFTAFLVDHCGCGLPGISKHIKIIKRLMAMSMEEKLHHNDIFRERAFKRPRTKTSTKIYLTTTEIEQLEGLDLSGQPILERERDRFLLAYWLLMRFSDVNRIRESLLFTNNGKQFIRYQSEKTDVEATLPIKQSALAIMKKYGFNFSFSSNVQANRELKTIAAMAGINTGVTQDGRNGPKSSFVTTHTARRSAATNLYLEGVSLKMIADLGGWKDLQSLRTYLRASGLDTAQVAVDLDFFT